MIFCKQLRAELEVDVEIDHAARFVGLEAPMVDHALEGSLGVGDVDAPSLPGPGLTWLVKRSRTILKPITRSATMLALLAALADARGEAPGQELGITLDLGDQPVHLIRAVGDELSARRGSASLFSWPGAAPARAPTRPPQAYDAAGGRVGERAGAVCS